VDNIPRILAVGTATPPNCFTQEQVLRLANYTHPAARKIFLNSDVETRHLFLDPQQFSINEGVDVLQERYRTGALLLARQAAECCLEQAGLGPEGVHCLLVCSCTGYLCPDLSTLLVKEMGFSRHVQRGSLMGLGCAGALPGLQRAYDHARAHPGHDVLLITVEICSAAYYIDDTLETIVANAICADGAAACLVSCRGDGPRIAGFATVLQPEHQELVGFGHREGRLRVILAPEIRDLAPPIVRAVLDELLPSRGLQQQSDIRHWLLHPGGRKVIDRLQEALGLSDRDVARSRSVLRRYGNMSSPTVLFVLRELLAARAAGQGDRGVLLALGPGFAAEAALLEW
jgi:predicted naringenin-chalcone synthase